MDDTVMNNPILTVELRRKRDVLLARHYARQLSGLLGITPLDKLALSAAVFELAWKAYHSETREPIVFSVEEDHLVVLGGGLRLQKPLPARSTGLAPEDLSWAVQELRQFDPRDLF